MPQLISAHQISKTYSAKRLFNQISFQINSDDRIGLIGPNGAGKSTLLNILAGYQTADEGILSKTSNIKISFLAQDPLFKPNATIHSAIIDDLPEEWESHAITDEMISKLSLNQNGITPETKIETLSGGLKKRVAIARELAKKPDLFLLDEPTNHLDVESILLLEDLIARGNFATVTITHDRLFLQRISNRIFELDKRNPDGLLKVEGSYTQYLEIKEQLITAQERREIILKNTLRRETEWLRRGAKARTTKQQARIQRHGELAKETAEISERNFKKTTKIEFSSNQNSPKKLLEAKNLSKIYDHKKLFENLNLILSPGTRLGLLGANGCGKSTLIRCLLQAEQPNTGSVFHSDNLKIAYFEQNRQVLNPDLTLAETICPRGEYVQFHGQPIHIMGYLDRFLFTKDQANLPIRNLSGGEQSRVLIALLMLQPANLLILDEPTNDLDMVTLSVLEECLKEFDGAVLLVTHDRYFLDQVATQILAFQKNNTQLEFFMNLEQWEEWEANSKKSKQSNEKQTTAESSNKLKKRKLSFNEQRELDSMESNIQIAEKELALLGAESSDEANLSNAKKLNEIAKAMSDLQNKIDHYYARWAELEKIQSQT